VDPAIFFPRCPHPALEMSVCQQEHQLHTTGFSAPGRSISKIKCIIIRKTLKKGSNLATSTQHNAEGELWQGDSRLLRSPKALWML